VTLLLDSHLCLWLLRGEMQESTREIIRSADEVVFSDASLWEFAVKSGQGKLNLGSIQAHDALLKSGLTRIRLELEDFAAVQALAHTQGNPFDRMLVAQAIHRGIVLLTRDEDLAVYGPAVQVV